MLSGKVKDNKATKELNWKELMSSHLSKKKVYVF